MMAFCLVVGWVVLMPDDFRDLGMSIASAATFSSNLLFWEQANYFTGAVDLKPLIHTWSLAVEEQFYIVLPLFLVLLARYRNGRYIGFTGAMTALSFGASVIGSYVAPSASYYLLPSRACELLIGSLLSQGAVPQLRGKWQIEVAAAAGAAAILGSAVLLTGSSRFPGLNALWPCIGAGLILHAGSSTHRSVVAAILGSKPFVFLGLISYSLYLWHWPLIVFARYELMSDFSAAQMTMLGVATFVAATLCWRFVERPFRNRHRVGRTAIFAGGTTALVLASALGAAIYADDGVPSRFAGVAVPQIVRADKPRAGEPTCFLEGGYRQWAQRSCLIAEGPGAPVLLWSDSHGYQYRDVIRSRVGPAIGANILLFASAGCLPVFGVAVPGRPDCRGNNDEVPGIIQRFGIRRVVLAGHWRMAMTASGIDFAAIERTVARLRSLGVTVAMIGDSPEYSISNPQFLAYRLSKRKVPTAPFFMTPKFDGSYNGTLSTIVGTQNFFDPMAVLCTGHHCLVYQDGQTIMSDAAHLSPYGEDIVGRHMAVLFR